MALTVPSTSNFVLGFVLPIPTLPSTVTEPVVCNASSTRSAPDECPERITPVTFTSSLSASPKDTLPAMCSVSRAITSPFTSRFPPTVKFSLMLTLLVTFRGALTFPVTSKSPETVSFSPIVKGPDKVAPGGRLTLANLRTELSMLSSTLPLLSN